MNNLYSIVEDGLADEFDKKRLLEVKQEILKIEKELSDIQNQPVPYLDSEQINSVIQSYRLALKIKSTENIRALIENFVDEVVIDEKLITFKINLSLNGAGEGT